MAVMQDTGSCFFNKSTTQVADDKFKGGVQYDCDINGKKVILAKAADDTITLKIGDKYEMLEPRSNNYGLYYFAEIEGKKYFVSPRTNAKGSYFLAKLRKEQDGSAAPAAPKTYGKRS